MEGNIFLEELEKELLSRNLINNLHKNFLDSVDVIGFDVDHTISIYNTENMINLLHNSFSRFLIEYKNYPVEILQNFSIDFLTKLSATDLVIDLVKGNALLLDDNKNILKAFHGKNLLKRIDIQKCYGENCTYHELDFYNNFRADNYVYVIGNFDYHLTSLFLISVDLYEQNKIQNISSYKDIYKHLIEAFEFNFRIYDIETDSVKDLSKTGYYFPEIINNPKKYLYNYSAKDLLFHLKSKGKIIFFATNSHLNYADFILKNTIGEDYLKYFDFGFYFAQKPIFFQKGHEIPAYFPNMNISNLKGERITSEDIINDKDNKFIESIKNKNNNVFIEGSYILVEEISKRILGKDKVDCIYVGDNYYVDCFKSSILENWRSIAVFDKISTGYIGNSPIDFQKFWELSDDEIQNNDKNSIFPFYTKIIRETTLFPISHVDSLRHFK